MQTVQRLIGQFVPENYNLSLILDRPGRAFNGTVTITGDSPIDLGYLTLHAKDLLIQSALVDGKEAEFEAGQYDELVIRHDGIAAGRHIVAVSFSGTISDAMHGMYPCYYSVNDDKKELLATQFESHHAREVFPCIDEPEAKASFDLTLTSEPGVTVLANTDAASQTVENERLVTRFETTPRMSTYLLAWVVGELQHKSAKTKSGVDVGIWATHAHPAASLDFALNIGVKTIDFFDDYFNTPYPLKKCDHVALPDFSAGAMENWGLITYREMALLADPATTSISSKHYVATVIAHEVSHMWFGNLVTMRWWNNLWLNESFATLMEYIAIDAIHPEWDIWMDFSTNESVMALRRDSIDGIQPVQTDVNHPDEISTLFDGAIVYAKGARLMRMCERYIGAEAFRAGLRAYFDKHAYGSTDGDDLWRALGDASGKDVSGLMNTWISQPGYPVVMAQEADGTVNLDQQQFFAGPHEPSSRLWPIPLNASSAHAPELLTVRSASFDYNEKDSLRLNVGNTAHFITHYDRILLDRILQDVSAGVLLPLDRLQILDEQILLARGGYITSDLLIPLLNAYKHETTEYVWDMIGLTVRELKKFVEHDPVSETQLRTFAARLARAEHARLGWDAKPGEPESDSKLRSTIIGLMLYGEDKEAISQAFSLMESRSLETMDPELRPLILSAAVRHGGDNELVDKLIASYRTSVSPELQRDIVSGITSTKSTDKLIELLALIKDQDVVRTQDAARWLASIIYSRDGRPHGWSWLRTNWDWIEQTFSGDKSYDDFAKIAANTLNTREYLDQYQSFFEPKKIEPALTRVIELGIKEIQARVSLIERDGEAVRTALADL